MAEEPTYNRALGLIRLAAIYALLGSLLLLARPRLVDVVVGLVFVIAGESVRFWAAGHLFKTEELITSGPYRFCRNPLYLGRLLIFTGIGIAARMPYGANWWVLLGGYAVFFLYYLPRKERVEPARLLQVHGEAYERYNRAVPSLFPTLRPYADASSGGWVAERMLRNREHWMVIGLALVFVVLLWRVYS